jgi:hypothetical protein
VERDRLYGQLGIESELKNRLALLGSTREGAASIRAEIAKGVDVGALNATWRADDRAVSQSLRMGAGGAAAKQREGAILYAAAMEAAKQQIEDMEVESPISTWIGESINTRSGELRTGLMEFVKRELPDDLRKKWQKEEWTWGGLSHNALVDFDPENRQVKVDIEDAELRSAVLRILGTPGNTQNNYGGTVINQNDQASPAGRPYRGAGGMPE